MSCKCLHKEFFGLGLFVMGIIYFWLEVIWQIIIDRRFNS